MARTQEQIQQALYGCIFCGKIIDTRIERFSHVHPVGDFFHDAGIGHKDCLEKHNAAVKTEAATDQQQ